MCIRDRYKGFQVSVQNDMLGPILFLQGEKEYSVELKSSDSGNMVRIENRLNALDKAVEAVAYTHLTLPKTDAVEM